MLPVIGLVLIVVFLSASVLIHSFWTLQDPRAAEQINFLRNHVLAGATDWPLTLG